MVLSLGLVLGLGMPGSSAWAARGARSGSSAKKAKARKGAQPQLSAPEEGAELKPGSVTFTWRAAAKLVRLEVARDEEFTDTVVARPVKGSYAVVELEPGTYYWRVTGAKRAVSDPRMLTVAAAEPQAVSQAESLPVSQPAAQPESQPMAAEGGLGLGLDLTATSDTSAAAAAPPVAEVPTEPVVAEPAPTPPPAERTSQKRWFLLVGGSAAYGPGTPNSMATLRYEASVAFRLANPFELSLAVGGTSLRVLGTRDATWPYYTWLGQYYLDLSARYRLVRFQDAALYALVAGRASFFTATKEQLGFLVDRSPASAGAGLGYRFRVGVPVELGLRGNVIPGKQLGGEVELGLRVLVY